MYDALIIGAGMSGLAAGIRLGLMGKKVFILEKHNTPGGLNSYYQRKKILLDVGLHALTNFCPKEGKGPLKKIFRQLRIPYESFQLKEQLKSQVVFPEQTLSFTNDLKHLIEEINTKFPREIDGFLELLELIKDYDPFASHESYLSAKKVVRGYLKDDCLVEMIFTPPLIYGSAWENDMDFPQFVIMFKALYLEGLSRPLGGVRTIIKALTDKFQSLGGEIGYRQGVEKIIVQKGQVEELLLTSGKSLKAKFVLSSAGLSETQTLLSKSTCSPPGKMTFSESIMIFKERPIDFGIDSTLIFYNDGPQYHYENPQSYYDPRSAVLCFPNNFTGDNQENGVARITTISNFDLWNTLDRVAYHQKKEELFQHSQNLIKHLFPTFSPNLLLKDVFTPKTIQKFTGHFKGTVYGNEKKLPQGDLGVKGLYLCGTDQGFLGIVGAMLSGISMANLYGFKS